MLQNSEREREPKTTFTDMSLSLSSLAFSLYKPNPFNPKLLAKPSECLVRASSSAAPGIDFSTLESAIDKVPFFLLFPASRAVIRIVYEFQIVRRILVIGFSNMNRLLSWLL